MTQIIIKADQTTPEADPVLQFDDPRLRQISRKITESEFDSPELHDWIRRLNLSRQVFGGIGIAAPQIGLFQQIVVIDIPAHERVGFGPVEAVAFHTLINPEIVWYSEDKFKAIEGCLSVRGYEGIVKRPAKIGVVAWTPTGQKLEFEASSLYARCIQHEVDHLNGILYPDLVEETRDLKKVERLEASDSIFAFNKLIGRADNL